LFLIFFPAIMAGALFCGWGGGFAALGLSTLIAWYFLLPPYHSFAISDAETLIQLLGFLLVGTFGVALIVALVELAQRLDAAARLQEGLFRELQHRTANNMQIVAAMLHLARGEVADEAALEVLDRAAVRISSMAQLHRRLYSQEAYERGLEPILRDVLGEAFDDVPVDVRLDVGVEGLSLDQMTSILLLVNEAAINAAKHVFRSREGGHFEVTLTEPASGQVRLVIHDDGPGLPGSPNEDSASSSLGMTIMHAFAKQLGGSLQVLEGPGTGLQVDMPLRRQTAAPLAKSPCRARA
jgi:two-component sensor histidine kinase